MKRSALNGQYQTFRMRLRRAIKDRANLPQILEDAHYFTCMKYAADISAKIPITGYPIHFTSIAALMYAAAPHKAAHP